MNDPMLYYPRAVEKPLIDHSAPGTLAQKNLIVLHITDGSTAQGAITTFAASVAPLRTSAHFVIDRDGTVYQLLPISDVAWHASAVNRRSVGIEHVAMSEAAAGALNRSHPADPPRYQALPATDEQYRSSAQLISWLARQMGVPVDRAHIQGHNEASPQDGHVGCCTAALDPDRVVKEAAALA